MTESPGFSAGALPRSSAGAAARWNRTQAAHRTPKMVNGVLSVLVGIAMLVWPNASLVVVAVLIAITLAVNGIVQILVAVTGHDATGGRRLLGGVLGALSLLAGALCLRAPLQTLALLAVLIGSWWIVTGVLTLVGALANDGGRRGWSAFGGAVALVAGLVVLLQPGMSLRTLAVTVGIALVVIGVLICLDAARAPV
ncbi:hypothetical protein BLA60_37200 [Actinophytocola xinjiangensis]|uniref:Acid-resistance membrane protein n=1 Tax=Actinophytocola xinjiangensis TaxID=485602 RepID=A0A7Z0WE53_9PSEU|nr:DUF308 domain-containing protein [Actinophytocola xinjiangensis]OLF05160.1 hypothetical protein BLA60_37200 [Actinophytocola xinjiangensis]